MTSQQSSESRGDSASVAGADVTVSLRNINPGTLHLGFVEGILALREQELLMHRRWLRSIRMRPAGSLLHIFRNAQVADFLDLDTAEWMLFLDSDVGVPADLLDTLIAFHNKTGYKVMGVNYMIQLAQLSPSMYFRPGGDLTRKPEVMSSDDWVAMLEKAETQDKLDKWTLVDGAGAGCLFIHRTILEAMRERNFDSAQQWFATETINGVVFGEDLTFIDRLRRMDIDFPVLYDQGLQHYKGDTVMRERA